MPIEGESKQFYNEYVEGLDWSDADKELFLPYVLMPGLLGGEDTAQFITLVIFAALAIVLGIYLFVGGVNGSYLKPVMKYCESTGNKELAMSKIEQFYASTPEVARLRISQEYFMATGNGPLVFTPTQDIIWVYQYIVKHTRGLITTNKAYSLILRKADGSRLDVSMKNKKEAEETMNHIGKTLPYLFFGYDDQLMRAYKQNRQALIDAVNERKGQNPEGMNQQ